MPSGVVGWMLRRKGSKSFGDEGLGEVLEGSAEWERVEEHEGEAGTRWSSRTV